MCVMVFIYIVYIYIYIYIMVITHTTIITDIIATTVALSQMVQVAIVYSPSNGNASQTKDVIPVHGAPQF